MTRLFYLLTAFFLTTKIDAQIVETAVYRKIDSLAFNQVDTIFVYSVQCNGFIPIDSCQYEAPQYLLWIQNKRYFIQKFEYCERYKVIELDQENPLSFYLENREKIKKEDIKAPTYVVSKKGNVVKTNSISTSHSCFHEMLLIQKGKKVKKTVSDFNLTYKAFDNGNKNMYFEYNQRTKVKAFIERMRNLLKKRIDS